MKRGKRAVNYWTMPGSGLYPTLDMYPGREAAQSRTQQRRLDREKQEVQLRVINHENREFWERRS